MKIDRQKSSNLFFNFGIFFLASAPSISIIFFLFPIYFGLRQNFRNILKDKLNYLLAAASIFMLIKSTITSIFFKDTLKDWHHSLNWIGLGNWLPLFFIYLVFQSYLETKSQREKTIKYLLAGSVPILFSCLSQYFLGWFGPYEILNGFIVWFQKPLTESNQPVSGLFNNPNYTGVWLSLIWPFSLALMIKYKEKSFYAKSFIIFLLNSTIVLALSLVNSRGSWLGLLVTLPFIFGSSILLYLIPTIIILGILLIIPSIEFFPNGMQEFVRSLIPDNILSNFTSLEISPDNLPRIMIWKNSIELILQKPFLGWGAASFPLLYFYKTNKWQGHPHNLFFELSISYGLIISIIIFIFFFLLLKHSFKKIYIQTKLNNKFEKAWWTSSFILLLLQMFDVTYFDLRISIIFWILLSGLRSIYYDENYTKSI